MTAAVYWEMVEPEEGKYNFVLVDSMLAGARKQNLHLVILWFGSWKNGFSTYPPGWVKNNFIKYPRAKDKNGKSLQMLSTFGEASVAADARAFRALMEHIRLTDSKIQTVIAVQVENEIGLFGAPRDYIEAASQAYASNVPSDLMGYLNGHKHELQPELDSVWKANGYRTSGTWEEVFGKSILDNRDWKTLSYLTEEFFTVYQYAKYVGFIASEGKKAYPLPMYVNTWIKQMGFAWPGKYPSGGPTPHTLDIWRAAAPSIDFLAPDIYASDVQYFIKEYHRNGNPVFVPEIGSSIRSANLAFWAFGEQEALCISPFGIDDPEPAEDPITKTYAVLKQAQDFIALQYGKGTMHGIYLDSINDKQDLEMAGYNITASLSGPASGFTGFRPGAKRPYYAGGILVSTGQNEFVAIGRDYSLRISLKQQDDSILDVQYLDEGYFVKDKWMPTRRLNGDEGPGGIYGSSYGNTHQATIRFQASSNGDYSIVRFRLYKYK